jgi:hypothetical protein
MDDILGAAKPGFSSYQEERYSNENSHFSA